MKLVLPIVLAAFLAFVFGWIASRSFHVRAVTTTDRTFEVTPAREPAQHEAVTVIAQPVAPIEPKSPATRLAATQTVEGLISEALRTYALAEIDAGWHETRKDPLPDVLLAKGYSAFEKQVLELPRIIGRDLARTQSQIESVASDDPFVVMEALAAGDLGPQIELVRDGERMARFFACESGPRIEGPELVRIAATSPPQIQPGSLIDFPPGVHELDSLSNQLRSFPRCLTIAGAGMDRTLLRFRSLHPYQKLDRLEIRDCTLETSCEAIDLRVAGVWRAQRVRFVGFDCGAGGSSAVSVTSGGVVLELKSCRIEGGFGRSPMHGNLFDVRTNAFLARFEDCTISTLDTRLSRFPAGSTILLRRCRFENLLDRQLPVDRKDDGIVIEATTFELRAKEAGEPAKRDLAELFPARIQPTQR